LSVFFILTVKINTWPFRTETQILVGEKLNIEKNSNLTALYIRVSTLNQIDKDSLKTQEDRLINFCKANGISEYKVYRDPGYSAKDTKRPALECLMKDIKDGKVSGVFVVKLDRITRSVKDLINLTEFFNKYSIKFVSISENIDTSSAMGRAMQSLLGIFAQLEREVTAERVAIDMQHRASRGKWNGGVVPYGYTIQKLLMEKFKRQEIEASRALEICPEEKKLYIDPEEAPIVRRIFETFLETNSVRKTTIRLNKRGIKTRKGQLWSKTTIHRILSSPIYSGFLTYGKRKTDPVSGKLIKQEKDTWTITEGEHDGIISFDVFERAQSLLSQNQGKPTKSGRTYLLSGIIRCGLCGGAMTGHTFINKGAQKQYSYYKCYSKLQKGESACKGVSLPAVELEEFIINKLRHLSADKVFLSDQKKMMDILKSRVINEQNSNDINRIDDEIGQLTKRLDTLLDKLERSLISDEDFQPRYLKIKSDISILENEKAKLVASGKSKQIALNDLESSFEQIAAFDTNWDYLDEVGKGSRIKSIVKEIKATNDKIEMDIYLDLANMSRTDRDSWLPEA
jgi:site-specific DNA recombinase